MSSISGLVDLNAATVESADEADTVSLDANTLATPHCLALCFKQGKTPKKLSDKFPPEKIHKHAGETVLIERSHSADILLNSEKMPRSFVELWCECDRRFGPKWYIKKNHTSKTVLISQNGKSTSLSQHQQVEIRDQCKIKLECLTFTARTEDGDPMTGDFEVEVVPQGSKASEPLASDVQLLPTCSLMAPCRPTVVQQAPCCHSYCASSLNTCTTCAQGVGMLPTVFLAASAPAHSTYAAGACGGNVHANQLLYGSSARSSWADCGPNNYRDEHRREPQENDDRHALRPFDYM